ncbi:MAG: (2Fe-2S)-binding domain protein [Burkholderiales bacterium]|jgi:carbon-monoxide dehydrogenase small subunit|nr:(2Fe-2S)-binding domain protein [Burkholderiales bacterium]
MRPITLTVNGRSVTAGVEPRTHLADFLRETLTLTGTHLGCEQGVCGACTLLVDGIPVRSCITFAVACEGASVTTIEGLDEDEIASALRDAFSREHGLQCGYCTPGVLVSARDIVMRMPQADERAIRIAMSGNLCRCTGYAGIVRAIERVLADRNAKGRPASQNPRVALGPAGAGHAAGAVASEPGIAKRVASAVERGDPVKTQLATENALQGATGAPQTTLRESFTVEFPREKVWAFFDRPGEVATCLPGTSLAGTPTADHIETRMRVRAGPIVAEFDGAADVARDPASYSGVIRGHAHDARSRSATRGEIRYRLLEEQNGTATRIELQIGFTLTGPLAQFSRSNLLRDIARRMTEAFARNLQARLGGSGAQTAAGSTPAELNAGSLILPALWARVKTFLRALLRR